METAHAASEGSDSTMDTFLEKAKEGMNGSVAGTHYYWNEGLHIDRRNGKVRTKIGGKLKLGTGCINPDNDLKTASPALENLSSPIRNVACTSVVNMCVAALPDCIHQVSRVYSLGFRAKSSFL